MFSTAAHRFAAGTLLLAALIFPAALAAAGRGVFVAAAANFVPVLEPLDAAFIRSHPGTGVLASTGASGSLYAQIRGGAPFDVFLSADLQYPRRLALAGAAEASSLTPFARGRLVLWTASPALRLTTVADAVRNLRVHRLAMANPATAPYGRAARQVLDRLGLYPQAAPKLVLGENIGQTAQFVETGNAEAGFVALSLVLSPEAAGRGSWIEVPPALYDPLTHAAILTARGAANPAARTYLAFLRSPVARKLLERFGYGIPP